MLLGGSQAARSDQVWLVSAGASFDTPYDDTRRTAISDDGRFVLLETDATQLIPGTADYNGRPDLYVVDLWTDQIQLITHDPLNPRWTAGWSANPWVNTPFLPQADAEFEFVLFRSGLRDLVSGQVDDNDAVDLFRWERASGTVTLVSRREGTIATAGNGSSFQGQHSSMGEVLFVSNASDLMADGTDANAASDVFISDPATGELTLISHKSGEPTVAADGASTFAFFGGDDGVVVFSSTATDVVEGVTDSNGALDVFVHERRTGGTSLASHTHGAPDVAANGESYGAGMSDDHRYLALRSKATDLVSGIADGNSDFDAFLLDRQVGATTLISESVVGGGATGNGSTQPLNLSGDGRFALLWSSATDLVPGVTDSNNGTDVMQWDRLDGSIRLISRSAAQPPRTAAGPSIPGQQTDDGRYVSFRSSASDIIAGGIDNNGGPDFFLWDRIEDDVTLVSHVETSATQASEYSSLEGRLSADGQSFVFTNWGDDLVSSVRDVNWRYDAFVWTRASGAVRYAYLLPPGVQSAGGASSPVIDLGGRWVAFSGWVPLDEKDPFAPSRVLSSGPEQGGARPAFHGSWISELDSGWEFLLRGDLRDR